jgi:hypothetical protein
MRVQDVVPGSAAPYQGRDRLPEVIGQPREIALGDGTERSGGQCAERDPGTQLGHLRAAFRPGEQVDGDPAAR